MKAVLRSTLVAGAMVLLAGLPGAGAQDAPVGQPLQLVQPEGAAAPPVVVTLRDALPKLANMLRMLRLGDGGLGCFHGGSEFSSASIDAALARVPGDIRAVQFADRSALRH